MAEEKLTLIVNRNPFKIADRDIRSLAVKPNKSLRSYLATLKQDYPELFRRETDIVASHNGRLVKRIDFAKTFPTSGDYIAVCPVVAGGGKGRKIFATVAAIAVMYFTNGAAKDLWNAGKYWQAALTAAAGVAVGGLLVNRLMPQPKYNGFEETTTTESHSWGNLQSLQGQGNPIPITYGTVRTAGQILAQHVTTDGDKQYLNILLCGSEGPIDEISDILINDNPYTNYTGVELETRLGTNDQTVIKNFNDTYADQQLSYQLSTSTWSSQITEGNSGQGIEVLIECPKGLYHVLDDGNFDTASVSVRLQYRPENGTWIDWSTYTISGATSSAVRRTYRLDNLPAARYEVRAICTYKSGTSNRFSTDVYWTQLSHIIYDDFARPGRSLIGLKALATDQLSGGVPSVSWIQKRLNVWVWDPSSNTYVQKAANNPAWAAYDLVHRARQLKNINTNQMEFIVGGVPAQRMDFQAFSDWAEYCTERNLQANIIIDQASDLWSSLKDIEAAGRGKVLMRGTKYSAICDAPELPVQLFTVGNIKQDSFSEEFLAVKDRANAIEVTFVNKDKNYQKDTFMVYGEDWDSDIAIKNPTQISLIGVTSFEQAWKEAKYQLRLNKYLLRTVSFETDVDAIACQVGDVILVQHDVPLWGFGGRIVAATANTVTLDQTVALDPTKTYTMTVRLQDDTLVQKTIAPVAEYTETNVLTVTSNFTSVPQQHDLYSFGELTKENKPFRVVTITRADDMTRRISALEYNEAVYTEATDVPVIEYSRQVAPVYSLKATEQLDASGNTMLHLSWVPPRGNYLGFRVEIDGKRVGILDVAQSSFDYQIRTYKEYHIKVTTVGSIGDLGYAETNYMPVGKPPADVQDYIVLQNLRQLEHYWTASSDISGVEIRRLDPTNLSWDGGIVVNTGISGSKFIDTGISQGTLVFGIKAIGKNGIYSVNMKTATIAVGTIPASNIIVAFDEFQALDGVCTNCYVEGSKVILDTTDTWDENSTTDLWDEETTDTWGTPSVTLAIYQTKVKDVGKVMTSLVQLQDFAYTSTYTLEWRYSETDPRLPDGAWDESLPSAAWQAFIDGGNAKFQYHQWRLTMNGDGNLQYLTKMKIGVDVPDQILKYPNEIVPTLVITNADTGVRIDFPAGTYIKPPTVTGTVVPGPGYIIPETITKDYAILKATTNGIDRITGALHAQFIGY